MNSTRTGEGYMKRLLLLSTLTAVLNLALISSAGAETYGGDATAAQVTVPATGTTIRAATGTLSITGGGVEASTLVGDVPSNLTGGVVSLTAGALHSAVFGVGTLSSADSSMGDVSLTISGNQISSGLILSGLGMGTIGGVLFTRYFAPSRGHAALIDVGAVIGLFAGVAVESVLNQATSTTQKSERTANFALGGMAAGLITSGILTRNMDEPKLGGIAPAMGKATTAGGGSTTTFGIAGSF